MNPSYLSLTPRDPIIARDGRPFGAGQGNRMRSLSWPLPSVVAGSFRTALVKANPDLDFAGDVPQRLMAIEVAGVFPIVENELYLPAPNDCVWDGDTIPHAVKPIPPDSGGADFPGEGLRPVMLTEKQSKTDFKPKSVPAWWPVSKLTDWLLGQPVTFTEVFLDAAVQEIRDHVCLDADRGAAAEGQLYATAGLNVTDLPRYGVGEAKPFPKRFAKITLSARVMLNDARFGHLEKLNIWHPLGGERRLVHWQRSDSHDRWECPGAVRSALQTATRIRMVLATPAIFDGGWRPGWLDANTLTGRPPISDAPALKLVGVINGRWKAVSGWSLQPLPKTGRPGPKPIRRMVPAGSVYFYEKVEGDGGNLAANGWLRPVSDAHQERNDGFGLAVWGMW